MWTRVQCWQILLISVYLQVHFTYGYPFDFPWADGNRGQSPGFQSTGNGFVEPSQIQQSLVGPGPAKRSTIVQGVPLASGTTQFGPTTEDTSSAPTVSLSPPTATPDKAPAAVATSVDPPPPSKTAVVGTTFTTTSSLVPTGVSSLNIISTTRSSLSNSQISSPVNNNLQSASNTTTSTITSVGSKATSTINTVNLPTQSEPTVSVIPISGNIFVPIADGLPPAQIVPTGGHPITPVGVSNENGRPIQTNKFYANLLFGDQTAPIFTYPFSLRWLKGGGSVSSWGLGISHTEVNQLLFASGNPPEYYLNPVGIDSIILSAKELGGGSSLTTDTFGAFSVNVNLATSTGSKPLLTLPLVQGMGLITGIYSSATVLIQSGVSFTQLSSVTKIGSLYRWTVILGDGHEWAIYLAPSDGSQPTLTLDGSSSSINGPSGFNGLVQIAKIEVSGEETIYDASAGVYPVSGSVSGTASGAYSLQWSKTGDTSKTLIMFALPHHIESFASDTATKASKITLHALTKGNAIAIVADQWNLVETLPTSMGFAPWSPTHTGVTSLPAGAASLIGKTIISDLGQDILSQTNLNSVYFSGKALAKFASVIYAANDLAKDTSTATAGLTKLKQSFQLWVDNQAQSSFIYDTVWKGVVTKAVLTDVNADFGAGSYNDHHFHYGYIVYAAAVIAHLDASWLNEGTNKAWINSLVRDYANSVDDNDFPFSRSFDWYHGHSWAKGLFVSSDGKDQESSSEDSFASYGIKMWGKATGDANMEARGNLMLAIQARSFSNYFLLASSNTVEPSNFIGNKVSGIFFENKVDHVTYFGTNIEYIQGIHMIPIAPNSGLTRPSNFIKEEWSAYFDNGRVDSIQSGWKGILYANLALVDPQSSWAFFSQPNFNLDWIDDGASLSWYLTQSACLGGVS